MKKRIVRSRKNVFFKNSYHSIHPSVRLSILFIFVLVSTISTNCLFVVDFSLLYFTILYAIWGIFSQEREDIYFTIKKTALKKDSSFMKKFLKSTIHNLSLYNSKILDSHICKCGYNNLHL